MTTKQEIIESMGRTLYVSAYADMTERAFEDGIDVSDMPYASMGADWMDVAPETSETARELARNLAKSIEELNGDDLDELYARAQTHCEMKSHKCYRFLDHDPDDFGHCLAMEALGHGVGWSDNHADHGLRVPNTDFHLFPDDLEGDAEGIDTRFC